MAKARRTHDVVATVGRYKDQSGEEKKRYLNVGSAFTSDDGNISLKLEAVPVTPEWSGWLSLYPVKDREQQQSANRPARPARQAPAAEAEDDDSIPF